MSDVTLSDTDQWLVWMWQHYELTVTSFRTFEDAVAFSEGVEDAGDGSTDCIEGPHGVAAAEDVKAERERLRERERAARSARPEYTHVLELLAPDGKQTAQWDWYTTEAEAQVAYEALRARFGDRVTLRALQEWRP